MLIINTKLFYWLHLKTGLENPSCQFSFLFSTIRYARVVSLKKKKQGKKQGFPAVLFIIISSFVLISGREIFKKSDIQLAEKRKPRISQYVNELLLLPAHISQGSLVVSFFHKRKEDPESFNQFPSHLNTKLEFDQGLQMDSDGVRDNVDEYLSIDNILNGQINASFDKSLSLGRQSQSNR